MTRRKQQNKNKLLKYDEHFFFLLWIFVFTFPELTRSSLQTLLLQEFLLKVFLNKVLNQLCNPKGFYPLFTYLYLIILSSVTS